MYLSILLLLKNIYILLATLKNHMYILCLIYSFRIIYCNCFKLKKKPTVHTHLFTVKNYNVLFKKKKNDIEVLHN